MSAPKRMTLPEIRKAGLDALRERLGPEGMIRFLQQFDSGRGDYSTERHALLDDLTVEEIARDIENRRQAAKPPE